VPVADLPGQLQGFAVAGGRLFVLALPVIGKAEVIPTTSFARPVVGLPQEGEGASVMVAGVRVLALPPVQGAEVGQGLCLARGAARGGRRAFCVAVQGHGFLDVAAGVELPEECCR